MLSSYIDVQFEDAVSLIESFTHVYKNIVKLWVQIMRYLTSYSLNHTDDI